MNRRSFITGLIAAPFVYKTGLLATSQVLLRPYGLSPATATIHDLNRLNVLKRVYAEAIDRMVYPALVVREEGDVDWLLTRRMQNDTTKRLEQIGLLLERYEHEPLPA